MKTTINLSDYQFLNKKGKPYRIVTQISNCPDDDFPRVLVYKSDNFVEEIEEWFINAEIYYLNPVKKSIIKIEQAKSKNEDWKIDNNYKVTVFNAQMLPIVNPDFKTQDEEGNPLEISESNLPYLTQPAFDRFASFRQSSSLIISQRQLWEMSVASDDSQGFFDKKEHHKTLVEIQIELYNQLNPQ